jgi:hypothetical protein
MGCRCNAESTRLDVTTRRFVWCHNDWGMEQVPNWVTGRVNAHNIFDGGTHGSFKNSFYRYLNAGIRVPFSTGTDWFMYDFSRVYVPVEGKLTVKKWLAALSAGKSYVTNGPLMEFTINGKSIGETVALKQTGKVDVIGKIVGRIDFGRAELVRNGVVIAKADTKKIGGHYEATIQLNEPIARLAWLCLRTPPPPVPDDPELSESVAKNEFDQWIFAHTSAIHVELSGERYFDLNVAKELLTYMKTSRKTILDRATFADEQEKARVVDVYSDAITVMKWRMNSAIFRGMDP